MRLWVSVFTCVALSLSGTQAGAVETGAGEAPGVPRVVAPVVDPDAELPGPEPLSALTELESAAPPAPTPTKLDKPRGKRAERLAELRAEQEDLGPGEATVWAPKAITEAQSDLEDLDEETGLPEAYVPGTRKYRQKFGEKAPQDDPGSTTAAPVPSAAPGPEQVSPAAFEIEPQGLARATAECAGTAFCVEYNATGTISPAPTYNTQGRQPVTMTNRGTRTWTSANFALGYDLKYSSGQGYPTPGAITSLPKGTSVAPGQRVTMYAAIQNLPAGTFEIRWNARVMSSDGSWKWASSLGSPVAAARTFTIPHHAPQVSASYPVADNQALTTLRPELRLLVESDDTRLVQVVIQACEENTAECIESPWLKVERGSLASSVGWTVPAGRMSWHRRYELRARIADGNAPEKRSPVLLRFTAMPEQPTQNLLGSHPDLLDSEGVNPYLGQFVHSATDLSLPGALQNVALDRIYNSGDTRTGAFGPGWSSMVDARWTQTTNAETVTIQMADGRTRRYAKNPDGRYSGGYGEPLKVQLFEGTRQITYGDTTYTFSASSGRLTRVHQGWGRTLNLTHDSSGRPTVITDLMSDRKLHLTWTNDRVTAVSTGANQSGSVWTYGYTNGRLTSVCDSRGPAYCRSYTYAASGKLATISTPGGKDATRVSYDTDGVVTTVARVDGTWSYRRETSLTDFPDDVDRVTYLDDARGRTVRLEYGESGALLRRSDNVRGHTIVQGSDRFQEGWKREYDFSGRLRVEFDPNGNSTEYTYDPLLPDKVSSVGTWRGDDEYLVTAYQYVRPDQYTPNDPRVGSLLTIVPPGDPSLPELKTTFAYDTNGVLQSKTEPAGKGSSSTTTYRYTCAEAGDNGSGQPVVNDPGAPSDATQPCGLLSKVVDASGRTTAYSYNRRGDLTRVIEPAGALTDTTYDSLGRITAQTVRAKAGATGVTTTYTYNSLGAVLTEERRKGADSPVYTASRYYDVDGNLTQVTEAERGAKFADQRRTSYTYDDRNRQISISRNGEPVSRTEFNAFGQPTSSWDGRGTRVRYQYHPRGQLKNTYIDGYKDPEWANPGATVRPVFFGSHYYDRVGRLDTSFDGLGRATHYTHTYDGLVKTVTKSVLVSEGSTPSQNVYRSFTEHDFEYDQRGNVVADTASSSNGGTRRTEYAYDDADRQMREVRDPDRAGGHTGLKITTRRQHDVVGNLTGVTNTDGTRSEGQHYTYDDGGHLATATVENGADDLITAYSRNAWGDILAETDPRGASLSGQLDEAYTTRQTFDESGNLTSTSWPATATDPGDGSQPETKRATSTRRYNVFDELVYEKDPAGKETYLTRDSRGRVKVSAESPSSRASGAERIEAAGPVAWWKLDDATTAVSDSAGSMNGTYVNDGSRTLVTGAQRFGSADKASDLVDSQANITNTKDQLLLGDATVSVWFKSSATASPDDEEDLLAFGGALRVSAYADPSETTLQFNGDRVRLPAVKTGSHDHRWNQLVVTLKGDQARAYVNGRLAAKGTAPASTVPVESITLGGGPNGPDARWNGPMQNVAVYDRALPPSTVQAQYAGAQGNTRTFTYDRNDNVTSATDSLGNTTDFAYDELDRLATITNPEPFENSYRGRERFAYDDVGNQIGHVSPEGAQTVTTYDPLDHPVTTVLKERVPTQVDIETVRTFNDFGDVLSVKQPGITTSYTYDPLGRALTETTTGRGTVSYEYDLADRPVRRTAAAPDGTVLRASYDLAGRPLQVSRQAGGAGATHTETFTHDAAGNLTKRVDARGNDWLSEHDARNQLVALADPQPKNVDGQSQPRPTLTFGYDAGGSQTRQTDGRNQTTRRTYDVLGQLTSVVAPSTAAHPQQGDRTWTYEYDPEGRQVRQVGPGGVVTQDTYDNRGNLTEQEVTKPGAPNVSKRFYHDADRRLIGMKRSADEELGFSYNDRGDLVETRLGTETGGEYYTSVLDTYRYDTTSRLVETQDQAGSIVYTYDGPNVMSATDSVSNLKHSWTYDAAGRKRTEDSFSGSSLKGGKRWDYGDFGRLETERIVNASGTEIGATGYTWDASDNLLTQTSTGQLQSDHSDKVHSYDEANRLVSSYDQRKRSGEDFAWDGAGNRTSTTPWSGTPSNKTRGSPTTFAYDARDRLTKSQGPTTTVDYGYDAAGNTTSITRTLGTSVSTRSLRYDGLNRLLSDSQQPGVTRIYDALDRFAGTSGTAGASWYRGLEREAVVDEPTGTRVARHLDGTALAVQKGSGAGADVQLPVRSIHGDVIAGRNPSTGAIASTRTYSAFGRTSSTSGTPVAIGFQGSFDDDPSGRVRADRRSYDPDAGRFLSVDPVTPPMRSVASANDYGYGDANPTSLNDVAGTWADRPGGPSTFTRTAGNGAKSAAPKVARVVAGHAGRAALASAAPTAAAAVGTTALIVGGAMAVGALVEIFTRPRPTITVTRLTGIDPETGMPRAQMGSVQTPAQVARVQATAVVSGKVSSSTRATGTTKHRWYDDENVYVRTVTSYQTTTVTTKVYGDGRVGVTRSTAAAPSRSTTKTTPIFDWENSTPVRIANAKPSQTRLSTVQASDDGVCGAGGSVQSCAGKDDQPGSVQIPGEPTPVTGSSGAGMPPPRTPPAAGGYCNEQPEDPDACPDPERAGHGSSRDDGMDGVRAAGRTGEERAGIIKNTDHIPSASGNAAYRIPDELNSSVLGEVKNVSHLSYTSQLRDFTAYAQANRLTFNLYVRESTTFSRPLQNAIDSGVIKRIPNLGP